MNVRWCRAGVSMGGAQRRSGRPLQRVWQPALLLVGLSQAGCSLGAAAFRDEAVVVANGPYRWGTEDTEVARGVAVRLSRCPGVVVAFRLDAISDAGVGALRATPEQRACWEGLAVGETVSFAGKTWRAGWAGSETSWRIDEVGPCSAAGLDSMTHLAAEHACPVLEPR